MLADGVGDAVNGRRGGNTEQGDILGNLMSSIGLDGQGGESNFDIASLVSKAIKGSAGLGKEAKSEGSSMLSDVDWKGLASKAGIGEDGVADWVQGLLANALSEDDKADPKRKKQKKPSSWTGR